MAERELWAVPLGRLGYQDDFRQRGRGCDALVRGGGAEVLGERAEFGLREVAERLRHALQLVVV